MAQPRDDVSIELLEDQLAGVSERQRFSSKTRKSALTRQRIMDAASELMVERGNTDFQMSEVSDRCGMSKGSLYYYFADRDELVNAIFSDEVDGLIFGIERAAREATSAQDALHAIYAEFYRSLRVKSSLGLALTYELAANGSATSPVTGHFKRAAKVIATQIERAKAEGVMRESVDSDVAAAFATGGFIAISMSTDSLAGLKTPDEVSAAMVDMILRGVGV